MGLGYKISGILSILLCGISFIGYLYYNDSQEKISILTENNTKLEEVIALNEKTIYELESNFKKANTELNALNEKFHQIRQTNLVLSKKLSDHRLGYLAINKPVLIEKIVNNASDNAGRCFEILSGSPLTQKEKDAKNAKEFNSECTWLWAPN